MFTQVALDDKKSTRDGFPLARRSLGEGGSRHFLNSAAAEGFSFW
jgi:hypothetical protein